MKIPREKASQRRHHRVQTPLTIRVDNKNYAAADWGLGGFRLENWDRNDLTPKADIEYHFKLPFQGFEIAFQGTAKIISVNQELKQVSVQFLDLSERQQELLSHFIEELVRGAMTPVADTILRIDSPVTPVSTDPDPSPEGEVPVSRWQTKTIVMCSLYFSAGLSLFFYISFTLYANFFSLEVESGVVSAPIERVFSTTDGRIEKVAVTLDTLVPQGTALIQIQDAKVEEQIALAQIRIERDRALLETRREELAIEQDKLVDYHQFVEKNVKQAQILVESLTAQHRLAQKDVSRHYKLIDSGVVSNKHLDVAIRLKTALSGELKLAKVNLDKQKYNLKTVSNGRYFTGGHFEGRVKEIKADVNRLKQEVTHTTQELLALYQRRESLTVHASSPGRIVQVIKSNGSSTKRGETIALFERDERRIVDVYLTQDEVIGVELLQPARIYFPSLDSLVAGKVIAIDRTEGFLHERESRYSWRSNEERTAKVTLAFTELSKEQIRQQYKPGLPAIIVFPSLATGTFGDFIRSFKSHTKDSESNNLQKEQQNTDPLGEKDHDISI
jgi:multidrug resistance efflux pump